MPLPLAAGVLAVSRFILTKGLTKAIKKFGKKVVDRTRKSKTFKEMLKKPPMNTKDKIVLGASSATAVTGAAGIGGSVYTIKKGRDSKKLDTYER